MGGIPSFRANLGYAIASNAAVAAVSALSTLVVPKFVGVEEYGYWQLFIFYGTYVLLIQLGASGGANLRYGGMQRSDIVAKALGLQALILLAFTIVVAGMLSVLAPLVGDSAERVWVVWLTAIVAVAVNLRHFVVMQMQAVSDFRAFGRTMIGDRIVFAALVASLISIGLVDFRALAAAEIVAKAISLALAIKLSRDIFVFDWQDIRLACREISRNVYVGLKLTLASTANLLILGVARFLIDRVFGVAVFGGISLVLNLSNLLMVFINAVGLVLFPALRRADPGRLPGIYRMIRSPLSMLPLAMLTFAHPIFLSAVAWLPQYEAALRHIPILLTIVVFESRMGLLLIPYYKALRKENALLVVNMAALAVSVCLSLISAIHLEDLQLVLLAIVIALALRAVLAEWILLRILGLEVFHAVWAELLLVGMSIVLHLTLGGWLATSAFGFALLIYALAIRKPLLLDATNVLRLLRRG